MFPGQSIRWATPDDYAATPVWTTLRDNTYFVFQVSASALLIQWVAARVLIVT